MAWRCEGSAPGLQCVWWWLGYRCAWRLLSHLHIAWGWLYLTASGDWPSTLLYFPGIFRKQSTPKHGVATMRVIAELLDLYWVYWYAYLCPSFSPSMWFSGLKAAGHVLYLLLRADVPNSNHILLKNVRVARGRMVNAFQSPLLFPPLNWLSRETTVINRDLQNIQTYYRSKPSLCSFICLLPVLKTTLAMLLLQLQTATELLSKFTKYGCWVPSKSETSWFWEGMTKHMAARCAVDALPLCLDFALPMCLHWPLS